jgi:hypothetical protein
VCFDQFTLIHGNSTGLDAGSDSSNVTSDQDLRHAITRRLQNSTDDLRQSVQKSNTRVLALTMKTIATHIESLLPNFSPTKNATIHPLKAPYVWSVLNDFDRYKDDSTRLYIETMMPSSPLPGWPKVSSQSGFPTIPEKTP